MIYFVPICRVAVAQDRNLVRWTWFAPVPRIIAIYFARVLSNRAWAGSRSISLRVVRVVLRAVSGSISSDMVRVVSRVIVIDFVATRRIVLAQDRRCILVTGGMTND